MNEFISGGFEPETPSSGPWLY